MNRPILLIMAAGLGSRYGGLKQIAPVDDAGHILIDYALYDAKRAGFERVVFVITEALEADFRECIGDRVAKHMEVRYAYQKLDDIPEGFAVPEGRVKPWGTAHAVRSARALIDAPFAVINADDYYGIDAFGKIYAFLENGADRVHHAMIGYRLENTLTEHGYVARGVCKTEGSRLIEIVERTQIEKRPHGAAYTEDGEHYIDLPEGTTVSMNMWGFGAEMMQEVEQRFAAWFQQNLRENPVKGEYFLPIIPNALIHEGSADITVLSTDSRWYGVTYPDDMPVVQKAIAQMKADGLYPASLWEG